MILELCIKEVIIAFLCLLGFPIHLIQSLLTNKTQPRRKFVCTFIYKARFWAFSYFDCLLMTFNVSVLLSNVHFQKLQRYCHIQLWYVGLTYLQCLSAFVRAQMYCVSDSGFSEQEKQGLKGYQTSWGANGTICSIPKQQFSSRRGVHVVVKCVT